MDYDENARIAEERLKPMLTDEFLKTLLLAVKTIGNSVDFPASVDFVKECFSIADKEAPENIKEINYSEGNHAV